MAAAKKQEYTFKVVMVGDPGTGISRIIAQSVPRLRFFSPQLELTIGMDFAIKVISWDENTAVRIQIWNIGGVGRYGNMSRVYYKEAAGAFVVFDITRVDTIRATQIWKNDLDSKVRLPNGDPIPVILLANKINLRSDDLVSTYTSHLDQFCKENGFVGWFATSTEENTGIEEAWHFLVTKMLENVGCVRVNKKNGSMSVEKGLWCELKQSSSKGTSIEQGASCDAKSDGNTLANVRKNNFFKVLVVGDLVTGKSSIIKQYVDDFFTPRYRHSLEVDFAIKEIAWDSNTTAELQFCDIPVRQGFGKARKHHYQGADGAFVVFDVMRPASLQSAQLWKKDLDDKILLPNGEPIPTLLLANKCDLLDESVSGTYAHLDEYCRQKGFIGWHQTSAKTNTGIDEAVRLLVSKILLRDDSCDPITVVVARRPIENGNPIVSAPQSPAEEPQKNNFKIIMVGKSGTGKTSIVKRYVDNVYSSEYTATHEVCVDTKKIHLDESTTFNLVIWDISGQKMEENNTAPYYQDAVAAFVVFDVTDKKSFEDSEQWKADIDQKASLPGGRPIPVVLLANKWDMISSSFFTDATRQLDEHCKDKGYVGWFKTSAKENMGIDGAAKSLVLKIFENEDV